MAHKNKIPRFDDAWRQIRRQIINTAATEGINFFKETFDRQGFTDVAFTPWEPKKRQDGYKILLRSGDLQRSVQVFNKSEKHIVFDSDMEYAEYHNEGATIKAILFKPNFH